MPSNAAMHAVCRGTEMASSSAVTAGYLPLEMGSSRKHTSRGAAAPPREFFALSGVAFVWNMNRRHCSHHERTVGIAVA